MHQMINIVLNVGPPLIAVLIVALLGVLGWGAWRHGRGEEKR